MENGDGSTPTKLFFKRTANGSPVQFVGTAIDITHHKEADEHLLQLGLAVEHSMTGISCLDQEGYFTMVRERYARMLGYQPQEMIGMSWAATVPKIDHPLGIAAVTEMLDTGQVEVELRGAAQGWFDFL